MSSSNEICRAIATLWLELLVDGKIVPPDNVSVVRQECDELTAIFVTILKRSKEAP